MRAISAIVPAAGLSSRFGGPNKLLQPWGDMTVVGAVVRTLLDCGLRVVVVTGRDADLVAKAVEPARAVFNPRFEEGLGASIAAGVAASGPVAGFLIALGDMPGLQEGTVRALLTEFEGSPPDSIWAPVYAGEPDRPGHPMLFGSAYREALQALTADEGARRIVRANRDKLRLLPVPGDLNDLDRPGDQLPPTRLN
ncbi:MAG: NTP transferase domain-containing protein [Fimbriimonadales bacterium]